MVMCALCVCVCVCAFVFVCVCVCTAFRSHCRCKFNEPPCQPRHVVTVLEPQRVYGGKVRGFRLAKYVGPDVAHHIHKEQQQPVAVGIHESRFGALCLCVGTRKRRKCAVLARDSRRVFVVVASPCVDGSGLRGGTSVSCFVPTVARGRLQESVDDASRPHRLSASGGGESTSRRSTTCSSFASSWSSRSASAADTHTGCFSLHALKFLHYLLDRVVHIGTVG